MTKKRRRLKPEKPPISKLLPGQYHVSQISIKQQKYIGRVVIAWSKLESAMQDTIWQFLGIGIADGRNLTSRFDAIVLISMLRALAPTRLTAGTLERFYQDFDLMEVRREDRNFIVHGTWITRMPDNVPVAMSLRPKSEPTEVMSETFPEDRMLEILHDIERMLKALVKLRDLLEESNKKPPAPSPIG